MEREGKLPRVYKGGLKMTDIKLAGLNRLSRDIDETKDIKTAVNAVDEILIYYNGSSVYLDREIIEYARKYYQEKLNKLEKEFEEA